MPGASRQSPTIAEAAREVAATLVAAGIADAPDEARRLLSAALNWPLAALISRSSDPITLEQANRIAAFVARRGRHEPLSRIVGEREFYGRPFCVSPATLDPRADSEVLVDTVLAMLRERPPAGPVCILDIGTGTGCLLITLLLELPDAAGVGTDISADALAVARANALRHGLGDRAQWLRADVAAGVTGTFDVVISNPPYIRSGDIENLAESVRSFDPKIALDGGSDGLHLYRRIAPELGKLVPDGIVALEVGYDQAAAVAAVLENQRGLIAPHSKRLVADVAGIQRVVAARTRTGRIQ